MRITENQIKQTAKNYGYEYATVRAVIDVECKGSGFLPDGTPTILFERHKFWAELGKINFYSVRKKMKEKRPDLCHEHKTPSGNYGTGSSQPKRLDEAVNLIYEVLPNCDKETYAKVRECALKACSWGLGQIMGFNHKQAGFDKLQDFVNAMYRSEQSQLEAVLTLMNAWGLRTAMRNHDWRKIAKTWNGSKYWVHGYHTKLRHAYLRYS